MDKKNVNIANLIERFDDTMEETQELTDEKKNLLASTIPSKDDLQEGLPELCAKANSLKANVENCDSNIKVWQESKKMWTARSKAFLEVLGAVLKNLQISGSMMKANGVKLASSSRTSLEVDEGWLLGQYQPMADSLQGAMPDFVKVSLSIDKNKLSAYLKQDNSLLVNNPDKIHTKTSVSTSIK